MSRPLPTAWLFRSNLEGTPGWVGTSHRYLTLPKISYPLNAKLDVRPGTSLMGTSPSTRNFVEKLGPFDSPFAPQKPLHSDGRQKSVLPGRETIGCPETIAPKRKEKDQDKGEQPRERPARESGHRQKDVTISLPGSEGDNGYLVGNRTHPNVALRLKGT